MAEPVQRQVPEKSPSFLCRIVSTLLLSLLFSIVVEWLCIAFMWPEEGHLHSQKVMLEEFGWFSREFQQSVLYSYPVELTEQAMKGVYQYLFVKTGLQHWLNTPKNTGWEATVIFYTRAYIESVFYVTMTFIIRLMIIVLTSPLFLLAAMVGFVDGLVQRDLRRFGIGRESAFKYHHAKRTIAPIMLLAWVVYLSIPVAIHPNFILIPAAILFGLSIAITVTNFKKYF